MCHTNNDCAQGGGPFLSCSPGGYSGGGACDPTNAACNIDADCALIHDAAPAVPMVCGPRNPFDCANPKNGDCIPACKGPSDCAAEQACESGHCVALPCTIDANCPAVGIQDYTCSAGGRCAAKACTGDSECHGGYCVNSYCSSVPGLCTPPSA
jgi:hypothetical protein